MDDIIQKYLNGLSTEDEERLLYVWLKKDDENLDFFKRKVFAQGLNVHKNLEFDSMAAFRQFKKKVTPLNDNKTTHSLVQKYFKYAAILLILVSSSFFLNEFVFKYSKIDDQPENLIISDLEKNVTDEDIVITSSRGKIKIVEEGREEMSYLTDELEEEIVTINKIEVPKGRIFRLILSDSTIVWLNAESKLSYPTKFISSAKNRFVQLEGEAFFDVSHNKNQPFVVNTDNLNIKVLGTKFNISSYPKEELIKTTLVEGSVQVSEKDSMLDSLVITPSFQAAFDKTEKSLTSKKVDTYIDTAWMENRIIFNDIPFEILADKIERAYNVEINNLNTEISKERFTGEFDIEDITIIFKALSTSLYFEYEIDDNNITILKP